MPASGRPEILPGAGAPSVVVGALPRIRRMDTVET